jgi:hypothetical protein
MSKTMRWYEANLDAAKLRRLGEEMLRNEYSSLRPWGFRLSERRKDFIIGSYYERIKRIDAIADPFGLVTEYERVEFKSVEFVLRTAFPAIEIYNPSRGVGDFFARIAEYTTYDVSVTPIRADVARWLQAIEARTDAEILGLEIADVALDAQVSGVLKVEGESDVRSAAGKLLGRRSHRVARATIRWHENDAETICEIRELGRARLRVGRGFEAVGVLRAGLTAASGGQR